MRSAVAGAVVLTLVGLGLAGALVLAQSDSGRRHLAGWLAPVLSAAAGYRVDIVGIDRGLPSRIALEKLTIADAGGTWLVLEGVSLSWRPAELLRGRLAVGALHADRLEIARLPGADPPQNRPTPVGDFTLAQSPVDVSIERLAIDALVIGEAVLGRPAQLRMEGRLAAPAGDVIGTDITIVRTDGREGHLAASVQLDPVRRRLHLEATLDEGEGGLLVRLFRLDAHPAISLRLYGDAPFENWRGSVAAEAEGLASLAGDLTAAATDPGYRIGFDGRAHWHGWMPTALKPAIASGIRLSFASKIAADRPLILDSLRLEGRDLVVEASGSFDPTTAAIAAQGNVAVGPEALAPEALAGYRLEGMGAEAIVSGRVDAIEVAAAGTVSRLSGAAIGSANLAWQASLGRPADGTRPLRVMAQATGVSTQDPRLQALLGPTASAEVEGRLSASGDLLDLQSARLTLPAATAGASGRLALNDGASELRIEGILADLTALRPLLGLAAEGEARIVALVQGALLAGTAAARIEGASKNLRTGIALADAVLGADPVLSCIVHVEPSRGLAVSDLRLDGAKVRITGEGRTDAAFTRSEARVRISPRKAAVPGAAVEAVEIIGVANHLGSRPAGDVRATLQMATGRIEAASPFAVQDGWLRLTGISATGFGARAAGNFDVELASGLWQGQVQAGLPAGGRMSFGRSQLSGRADLRVRLMPVSGRQAVEARLQGTSLAFGEAGREAVRIGDLEASLRVDDPFAAGRIDASLRASTLRLGGDGPSSLAVRAAGPREAIDARIEVNGPEDRLDRLAASLRIKLSGDGAVVTVTGLDGVAGGSRVTLASPLRIISGGGRLLIDDLDLVVDDGRLAGRLDLSPGTTSGFLRLERVPVRILRGWVPATPAAGTLTGSGDVTTGGGTVGGEMALSFDQLRFASASATTSSTIDADVRATFGEAGTELRLIAHHTGDPASPLLLATVILPLRLVPGSPVLHTSPTAPLTGDVRIRADLSRLARGLDLSNQWLGGALVGDLRLDGSLSRPEILGELEISDGVYENFVTGTLISGIEARAEMGEAGTARVAFSGMPAGGGSMAAEGRIDLAGGPDVELKIDARNARLVARDDVTATFDGQMTYRYGKGGGSLAGTLAVAPVEIRLRDRLPANVVLLPVIEINQPGGGAAPPPPASAPALVAALDVRIDLPRGVFVRGRGLESEWAGTLHAGGTTAVPTLAGEVHLVEGDFTFAGKQLRLRRGVVGFTGASIDPLLDVAAEYQAPQLTVLIEATGPVREPVIVVSSRPPLPESEVLAQIMFGKAPARLGAVEAVQLAAALDSLNRGDTFTADTLASVRQLLGLDVLNAGPTGTGTGAERGPSLEVGRYFSQHSFVGTRRGLADQTSAGRVEVEIVPGLSLQSDILQDVQGMSGSLGLLFKHDY